MILRVIACLFMLISVSHGITFSETLHVNGGGYVYAQTHTGLANDLVQGVGNQTYVRIYSSEPGETSLKSKYNLNTSATNNLQYHSKKTYSFKPLGAKGVQIDENNSSYSPDRYVISMNSPTGLQHVVSINGWSGPGSRNLAADNSIEFKTPKLGMPASELVKSEFRSNYKISGAGELSEDVLNFNVAKHPEFIGQTKIESDNFTLHSIVSDNLNSFGDSASAGLAGTAGINTAGLASMAEVNITTENGSPDPLKDTKSLNTKGFLSNDAYLKFLENEWKYGIIDEDRFLSEAQSLLRDKKINQSQYDMLTVEVSNALVKAVSVSTNLSKSTDAFLSGDMSKEAYLKLIDNMWARGDLGDDQYLGQLKDLLDKDKIDSADYDIRSTQVINKITESVKSDTGNSSTNTNNSSAADTKR